MVPGSIIDIVGFQSDIAAALMNRDELQNCNVVQYRQYLAKSEVDLHTALFSPRQATGGRSGTAVLVEMPTLRVTSKTLPGPEFHLAFPIVVLSVPTVAQNATIGSLVSAEDALQIVGDTLHGLRPKHQLGYQIYSSEDFASPARDVGNGAFEIPAGIVAYRVTHELRIGRSQTQRCDCPTLQNMGGQVTLSNGVNTPTAAIYYTLDGNYPCQFPTPGVASTLYQGPFPVNSGDVVRWVAYQLGGAVFQASFVGYYQAP